jgi:hypothetical protein
VTVGTPPQEQSVIFDSGSSKLVVLASSSEACQLQGRGSCRGGSFNPSNSNTYKALEPAAPFAAKYGDGTAITGKFVYETFGIGDVSVTNTVIALAAHYKSDVGFSNGIFGVGYSLEPGTEEAKYPNVPDILLQAGVINSRLYSVFLNDQKDISGSILFGGIDTSKYTGNLVTLNMLPQFDASVGSVGTVQNYVGRPVTVITAMSATVAGKSHQITSGGSPDFNAYDENDSGFPVLLDTGSAAWMIDDSLYEKYIAPVFDYVSPEGYCECEHAKSDDFISLEFGGRVHIKIPVSELIVPLYDLLTKKPDMLAGYTQLCLFAIRPGGSPNEGLSILGDSILRSMYVVYDYDNAQLSIAQASQDDAAKPNIVTVPAGPLGVAKAVASVVTAPSNTFSIPATVHLGTVAPSASTLASAIGTATGNNAVPLTARISGNGDGVAATGSPSPTKSPNAAAGRPMPATDFTGLWVTGLAAAFATLGASLIL